MTTHAMEIEHERSGATARIEGEIRRRTETSIAYYSEHSEEIDERLEELEEEWDLERVLQANAAGITLFAAGMGLLSGRKWFLVAGTIGFLMLRYTNRQWCPPVGLLRRMGYRTMEEIDHERYALMAIRGDFDDLAHEQDEGGSGRERRGRGQQQKGGKAAAGKGEGRAESGGGGAKSGGGGNSGGGASSAQRGGGASSGSQS